MPFQARVFLTAAALLFYLLSTVPVTTFLTGLEDWMKIEHKLIEQLCWV